MKRFFFLLAVLSCVALPIAAQVSAPAPTPAPKELSEVSANYVIGTVVAADAANKQLVISTKNAGAFIVTFNDTTKFIKVPPGAKTLEGAEAITLADIGAGDRVWARGAVSGNNIAAAKQVILMNKAEIAKKNDSERADWLRRGIVGKVVNVNSSEKSLTLAVQRMGQTQNIVLPIEGKVKFRRYTEDAIKFADAKPSSFEEVKVGDQMRALGTRNEAGTTYTPEQIVFGTFRTVTGKITAIDAAKNEVTVTDDEKKQAITFILKADSNLKRVPDFAAMMGGGGGFGGRPGGQGGPPQGGQGGPPAGGSPQGGQGPGGQGGPRIGGGGFDVQAMIDRMPETTLAELKPGETVVIAGTKGANPSRMTAVTLLSNVEGFLTMMARRSGGQTGGAAAGGFGGGGGLDLGLGLP
jgi:hypothetical protein